MEINLYTGIQNCFWKSHSIPFQSSWTQFKVDKTNWIAYDWKNFWSDCEKIFDSTMHCNQFCTTWATTVIYSLNDILLILLLFYRLYCQFGRDKIDCIVHNDTASCQFEFYHIFFCQHAFYVNKCWCLRCHYRFHTRFVCMRIHFAIYRRVLATQIHALNRFKSTEPNQSALMKIFEMSLTPQATFSSFFFDSI